MAGNNCNKLCYAVYPKEDGHIKRRKNQDEKILGSKDQFCAAFYHVPEWNHCKWPRIAFRQHFCLDEDKCVIGKEAKEGIKHFGQNADNIAREGHQFSNDAKELTKEVLQFSKDAKKFVTEGNKIAKKANEFYNVSDKFQASVENILKQNKVQQLTKKSKHFAEFVTKAKTFAKEAKNAAKAWYAQPDARIAVVKFEKKDGSILYEARYTNCSEKHAENFFEEDITKNEIFNEIVKWNPNGTVTLYLTLHPCYKSTGEEREGTEEGEDSNEEEEDSNEEEESFNEEEEAGNEEKGEGAEESQSSCAILKRIVTEILRQDGRQIKFLVKATNLDLLRKKDGTLDELAAREIKDLMRIEGVNVSEMTHKDWHYLFGMTKEFSNRQVLDREVQDIFDQIHRINLL